MEYIIIKRDSNTWNEIWEWLAKHPINEGIDEPMVALNYGEAWQYVGSFRNHGTVISEFRHRYSPKTSRREVIKYLHSNDIPIEDIEIQKNVK